MADTEENIQETGIPEITLTVEASENVQTPVDKTLSISDMAADAKVVGDAIADIESAISDAVADITTIQGWSGDDIPYSAGETDTIADVLNELRTNFEDMMHPVGSILATLSDEAPSLNGTWTEVVMPMTWGDAKNGTRSYRAVEDGDPTGPVHFWLRTA